MTKEQLQTLRETIIAEIMNIRTPMAVEELDSEKRMLYKTGHRNARYDAIDIVNKYLGGNDGQNNG